ncbi:MAG: NifB/NifX family molybdenum-iron cluster-binding protein [Prolixibacteraceae bacterium]|jgi:predicted Fe-Mo cluster-binding NifX family protein|nr:NifB/NifX family molybdenum-iron cluster-binding protein [Prolixibacteraceae bacterium]
MKTVISSQGSSLQAKIDMRFGRAQWFCVYNKENGQSEFVINENIDAQGGAGTKTAELMAELEAGEVYSGHFGPKAEELLKKLNIGMKTFSNEEQTIEQVINELK